MGCCESNGAAELACVPSAIASADRAQHFGLARQLFHELTEERRDLPNGYALRFRPSDFESVARFVANERRCCPFVSFEITVAGADGSVWLRMTGPDGTRAVLQAELELRSSCNCDPGAERSRQLAKWTTAGGLLAALGVCSACCLLPFALVTVGVATAWAGALEALAAYKWPLVSVTATLLAYGFRVAYRKPRATCAAGTACQARAANRSLKIGLWVVTALAIAGLLFEQLEPHLK